MSLHPRAILPLLASRVTRRPVTVLTGARQSGKTTLVRDLLPAAGGPPSRYISLDDPDERIRIAADPVRRLDQGRTLVILDEVQKLPGVLDAVKVLADRGGGRRFLLLGSSQILLMQKVRETLAGRATLLDLWPLALVETVEGATVPPSTLDRVFTAGEQALADLAGKEPDAEWARTWRGRTEDHLRWGGYPALEPLPEDERRTWLRDFRRTYLERDLADLGRVADLDQFALAQNFLAARTAQILSLSDVARDLGTAVNTVKRYVRFLEISYQVRLLRPFFTSVAKRLVKSPKLFFTDPGLARLLSERDALDDGAIYETFVLDEILRWMSWQADPPEISYLRTGAGREVDFILRGRRTLIAVEAKASRHAGPRDASAIRWLLDEMAAREPRAAVRRVGLVVTRGREIEPLGPGLFAVPDWRLFGPARPVSDVEFPPARGG